MGVVKKLVQVVKIYHTINDAGIISWQQIEELSRFSNQVRFVYTLNLWFTKDLT